jgi:hypothetical protein
VVVVDPIRDHPEGLIAILESVQPDAFRLQAPEEALDHPILLGRGWCLSSGVKVS